MVRELDGLEGDLCALPDPKDDDVDADAKKKSKKESKKEKKGKKGQRARTADIAVPDGGEVPDDSGRIVALQEKKQAIQEMLDGGVPAQVDQQLKSALKAYGISCCSRCSINGLGGA